LGYGVVLLDADFLLMGKRMKGLTKGIFPLPFGCPPLERRSEMTSRRRVEHRLHADRLINECVVVHFMRAPFAWALRTWRRVQVNSHGENAPNWRATKAKPNMQSEKKRPLIVTETKAKRIADADGKASPLVGVGLWFVFTLHICGSFCGSRFTCLVGAAM
jgi:hypothetical protein